MPAKKPSPSEFTAPDQQKLTEIQAKRLGAVAEIDARELAGRTVAEIRDKFAWRIDPELLFFRKICGKVVKKDPISGVMYPVPFATVIVEDTDCNLLGFFPKLWNWGWFFPLFCRREVLATVKTDKCGKFCVWIPRWDVDWILRWRKRRICLPYIFVRPSIRDLLPIDELRPIPQRPIPPRPGPDPDPLEQLAAVPFSTVEAISGKAGGNFARRLADLQATLAFSPVAEPLEELADARAFDAELPPPLPDEFRKVLSGRADVSADTRVDPQEAIRSAIALQLGVKRDVLDPFDIDRYIGPFHRCFDIFLPEWQLIVDVPDVTFRVTQDTNGDGTEETIYSEGYFDVRWNAGPIPNVTLQASPIAKESHACDTPDVVCGNQPALLFAGLMPLTDSNYFDSAQGYAKRPNRPKPVVGPRPDARTPFLWTLQLYGCVNVSGAQFYRVLLSSDNGTTFSAITGLSWNIYPVPAGAPVLIAADSSGWYAVLANPEDFHPARMVLEWPTPTLGKYILKIEVGDGTKSVINTSPTIAIRVDNTAPTVIFNTLKWKFSSEPDSAFNGPGRNLLTTCPTIHRGASPQAVEVQYEVTVSANHLRDAYLYVITCALASLAPMAVPAPHTSHWHETVFDNSEFLHGRYHISAAQLEGAYRFGCRANSRAMNPAGGDGGHLADWFYDVVYSYVQPEINVAVVNA